jgi:hypothetical protein
MRNMLRIASVVVGLGALAPLAANADAGLHMYQPSPLVTHVHSNQDKTAMNTGRTVHAQQMKAIQRNA